MSNLGFQAVYALINRHPASLCERDLSPEPGDEALHADGAPLISIESQRPSPTSISSPFPSPLKTIIPRSSGCFRWREFPSKPRPGGEGPLVIGGGIAVTLNPEPLADFFDLYLLGEGEAILPGFLDLAASLDGISRGKPSSPEYRRRSRGPTSPGFTR